MAELQPLAGDLTPEAGALAAALRELFDGLGITVRRYAARRHRDAGTLSRYLSGNRMPPWEVVNDLLTDLAEHLGRPVTAQTVRRVRELHRAAVERGSSPRHAVDVLSRQLADADRTSRRSAVHGDALEEALLDRSSRIADLETRLSQLEADWGQERERADRLEEESRDARELRRERDRLMAETRRLQCELAEALERRDAAEIRCDLLERQLVVAEEEAAVTAQPDRAPPAREDERNAFTVPTPPGGGMPKVLIVDDQPANVLALTGVLGNFGQELVVASNGYEALKALLQDEDFAVILMDIQMPGMDGFETAAHIKRRSRTRDIPIIFLTAMEGGPDLSFRGYAAGGVDYISKPFDPWALRAKVNVFTDLFLERRSK